MLTSVAEKARSLRSERKVDGGKRKKIAYKDFSKLREKLNEQQEAMYKRLSSLNDAVQKNELQAAWKFGETIAEAHNIENNVKYGKRFVKVLSQLLNHSTSYLYERMRFYERVPLAKLEALSSIRMKNTNTLLTYSHIVAVLEMEESVFWEYLNKAAEYSYTVSQLKALVREHKNSRNKKCRRGRSVSVPTDFKGQVDNIEQTLMPLCKRAVQWTDGDKGVSAALKRLPKDKLDAPWVNRLDRLKGEIDKAVDLLSKLSSSIDTVKGELTSASEVTKAEDTKSWRDDPALAAMGFPS